MSKFSIADMVQNSLSDKPADMKNSFADAMLDKIRDHLEAKKQDLVDQFYNKDTEDDPEDTEVDDEDELDFDNDDEDDDETFEDDSEEVEDSDTEDDDENT